MIRRDRTLRSRLVMIVLAIILPLTGLAFARQWQRRDAQVRELEQEARSRAEVTARSLHALFDDAQILLLALSRLIDPAEAPAAIDAQLQGLLADAPARYSNMWVTDTTGANVGAAFVPDSGRRVRVGDRRYFQDAMRLQRFTVGDVVESRTRPGQLVLPFSLPLRHRRSGRIAGAVGVTIVADSLEHLLGVSDRADGTVVTLVDSTGLVQYRSLDTRGWVGRSLAGTEGFAHNRAVPRGVDTTTSADGTRRIVAFETLAPYGWIVYVGIPVAATLDVVRDQFRQELALTLAMAVVLLLVGNLLVSRVVAPVESLTEDAMAIASGERHRRSAIRGADEIGALASAFNRMADTVDERTRDLEESAAGYRLLFDANPVPVFAWSLRDRRLLMVNPAAAAAFASAGDSLAGVEVTQLLHPEERARFLARMQHPPQEPRDEGFWQFVTTDGRVMEVQLLTAPYRGGADGGALLHVAIDVTARRVAERALDESREEQRHRQRLESLGSFAAGIAHDFNNYLASIVGFSGLVRERLTDDSESARDVDEILAAARRAAELTRQILVFSRRQVTDPQPLCVGSTVRAMRPMLSRLLGEQVTLSVATGDDEAFTRVDASQLEQVLVNLAANARDAMPEGGRLTFATRLLHLAEDSAEHPGVPPGSWVVLEASDNGPGIPSEIRDRVFDPFFTTKARGSGTGLGLAVVYGVVRQAGGFVRIADAAVGATFLLYFPVVAEEAEPRGESGAGDIAQGGNERILVVDDDPSVRSMMARVLSAVGYLVTTAGSAAEAVELCARAPQRMHLLLTDVVMPGASGRELADLLRSRDPGLRVLFMTGYTEDAQVAGALEGGGAALLHKPATREAVLRKVREVLNASWPLEAPPVGS